MHLQSRIIDGTFTDVTIDTVTNRAPTWWNDPHVYYRFNSPTLVSSCQDRAFLLFCFCCFPDLRLMDLPSEQIATDFFTIVV